MPAEHAPPGGIEIRGVHYVGGQFIPGDVVDDLSDEEREHLDAAHEEPEDEEEEEEPEEEEEEESDEPSWKNRESVPKDHTPEHVLYFLEHFHNPSQSSYSHIVNTNEDILVQIRNHPGIDLTELSDEAQENLRESFRITLGTEPEDADKYDQMTAKYPELYEILQPVEDEIRSSPQYKLETDPAAFLTDDYFNEEDTQSRLENVRTICNSDAIETDPTFFETLPDDTREAIAEDIQSEYDKDRKELFTSFGTAEAIRPILQLAMDKSSPGKPKKFNPKKKGYQLYELTGSADDELVRSSVNYLGKVWESKDGDFLIAESDAGDAIAELGAEAESSDLSDEDAIRKVWSSIGSYTVSHVDVPPSAKNFGSTSGGITPDVETDWDSNNVDVYAQISPSWFVLRRGNQNPDLARKPKYEMIERSKKPMTLSLPEPYWNGLTDTDPDDQDLEKHETQTERTGDTAKRIKAKRKWSQVKKEVGQLKAEHAQASNLIKSAEAHADAAKTIWHTFSSTVLNDDVDDFDTALKELSEKADSLDESVDDLDIDTTTPTAGGEKPAEFNELIDERADEIQKEANSQKKATTAAIRDISQHFRMLSGYYGNAITIGENALKSVQEELDNPDSDPEELTEHAEQIKDIQTALAKLKTQRNRLSRLKLA